ncbi:MAG: SulP family inorganic anion transporter [Nocardioidaceae bacterium]
MAGTRGYRESPFASASERSRIARVVPVSARMPDYGTGAASRDLLAGLTVAALALPSAMAYAEVAGLSPVHGLYALLLPCVAYALLGSSRQVIVGPEGSIAALIAVAILPLAAAGSAEAAGLAALLALMVGALFCFARAAKLSWVADYLSRPVLIGYIHGVVVVLIIGQLGKLLGLDVTALNPIPQLAEIAREIGGTSLTTVAVSVAALILLFGMRAISPRFPAALLVVAAGIAASSLVSLESHGVSVVGAVPAGLPGLSLPAFSFGQGAQLLSAAIGLFLITLADAILTARSFAGARGESIDASQELLALGASNLAAGASAGMPVGVSGSRTAVNDTAGSRSQLSGLIAAGAVALVLLFLTAPIAHLPTPVLGAVIVAAAASLVNLSDWRSLAEADRVELAIAGVTTVLVVVSGVLQAIGFALALSVIDVVRRSSRPHDAVLGWVPDLDRYADVSNHRGAEVTPGVVIYRLDDRIFFANADYVKGRIREAIRGAPGETHAVVLDGEGLTHVDSSGLDALADILASLDGNGIRFVVARLKAPVQRRLTDAGFSPEQFQPTVRAAVDACAGEDAGPSGVPAPARP